MRVSWHVSAILILSIEYSKGTMKIKCYDFNLTHDHSWTITVYINWYPICHSFLSFCHSLMSFCHSLLWVLCLFGAMCFCPVSFLSPPHLVTSTSCKCYCFSCFFASWFCFCHVGFFVLRLQRVKVNLPCIWTQTLFFLCWPVTQSCLQYNAIQTLSNMLRHI